MQTISFKNVKHKGNNKKRINGITRSYKGVNEIKLVRRKTTNYN